MSDPEPIKARRKLQFSLRMLFVLTLLSSIAFLYAKPWLFPPPHYGMCAGSQGLYVKGCCASLRERLVTERVLLPVPPHYSGIVQKTILASGFLEEADVTPFLVQRGSDEFLMLLQCQEWAGGENIEVVVLRQGGRRIPLQQLSLLAMKDLDWFCDLLLKEAKKHSPSQK